MDHSHHGLAISDYGAIGNLSTVALVGVDGSIDWCCFPHLAAPGVFGALVDARRGGHFRVRLASRPKAEQSYLEDTNILCTRWRDARGSLAVIDFMPVSGALDDVVPPFSPPELHRLLVCEGGVVDVEVEWAPRLDYARGHTGIERVPGGYLARHDSLLFGLGGLPAGHELREEGSGPAVFARFRLEAGERVALVSRWGAGPAPGTLSACERALRATEDAWRTWVRSAERRTAREWAHPYRALVRRSELALKLLTFADTGAIAAAATTSLPETLGGVRNWDYRFAWIRDAGLTAQALHSLGHSFEALRFLEWAEAAAGIHGGERHRLQIMYGLHGEAELPEEELTHLEGYLGSRPVRVGNAAAGQVQHDIHGELITSAYELERGGVELSEPLREFLASVADAACRSWREKDHGLWEIRGEPRHYTHSKLLCWAALDRACRLARKGKLEGDVARWSEVAGRIRSAVLREGYCPRVGAFTQAFGSSQLDASSLVILFLDLLPVEDPRVQGTLDAILEHLTEDGLVYRYRMDDGLPGQEGAFGLTTFWMVDGLALSGRREEAERLFEGMVRRANHVGLYAEQMDPRTGAFLGNFPQAFTHLGLINSSLYLAYARGERLPLPPLLGTREHREEESGPGLQAPPSPEAPTA